MNDDPLLRTVWRLATLPVRLLLIGLLWVFDGEGSPVRLLPFVGLLLLLSQLVQYLSGGHPALASYRF